MGTCKGRGSGPFYLWDERSRWKKIFERGTNPVLRRSRIGGSGGVRREEREDAAAEFFGSEAVGGGVEGARHDPELSGAAGRGVDHFRMTAGERFIFFVANEKNGKRAGGDGFLRRNFRYGKTGEFFVSIQQGPGSGREKSFAEPRRFPQTGVVVGCFTEIGEGGFGDNGFDAGIGGRGLQHDAGAHGFAEGKDVGGNSGRENLEVGSFQRLNFVLN